MKRNSKSWAQSLIFVLIITLAVPFGMMGFAEDTTTYSGNGTFGTYTLDTSVIGKTSINVALIEGLRFDGIDVSINGGAESTFNATAFEIDASSVETLNVVVRVRYAAFEVVDYKIDTQQGNNSNTKPGNHSFTEKINEI